jgi:hypothetical protein
MYTKEIETMTDFDLTIDGVLLGEGKIELEELNTFVQVKYDIPFEVTEGKTKVKVKFNAHKDQKVPKVFGIRVVKE